VRLPCGGAERKAEVASDVKDFRENLSGISSFPPEGHHTRNLDAPPAYRSKVRRRFGRRERRRICSPPRCRVCRRHSGR